LSPPGKNVFGSAFSAVTAVLILGPAPSADAALVTINLNNQQVTNGTVIIGAVGSVSVTNASTPSPYLTGSFNDTGVHNSNGPQAFFQAGDGEVNFPTVVLNDYARLTYLLETYANAQPGPNFIAMRTSEGNFGWLKVNITGGTVTSVTFESFTYEDSSTNIVNAPTLKDGVVVPEPSVALLGGFAFLGLLKRRR